MAKENKASMPQTSSDRPSATQRRGRAAGEPLNEREELEDSDADELDDDEEDEDAGEDEDARDDIEESEGYDADSGPLDTGYAGETVSLATEREAELLVESGLSVDPEDLGSRLLRDAKQEALPPEGREVDSDFDANPEPDAATLREIFDSAADEDAISPSEPSELDLTQNVITEGSLFDQPRNEGGIRHPAVRVNEVDATLERNARAAHARRGNRRS